MHSTPRATRRSVEARTWEAPRETHRIARIFDDGGEGPVVIEEKGELLAHGAFLNHIEELKRRGDEVRLGAVCIVPFASHRSHRRRFGRRELLRDGRKGPEQAVDGRNVVKIVSRLRWGVEVLYI